jgi:hypothetical protein
MVKSIRSSGVSVVVKRDREYQTQMWFVQSDAIVRPAVRVCVSCNWYQKINAFAHDEFAECNDICPGGIVLFAE